MTGCGKEGKERGGGEGGREREGGKGGGATRLAFYLCLLYLSYARAWGIAYKERR